MCRQGRQTPGEAAEKPVSPGDAGFLLEVQDLVSGYGQVEVLHGVSLSVGAKEIVAILGPNGAGKSTLLRTIVGLVRTRTGRVLLDGSPLRSMSPEDVLQRGIALVPEGRRVFAGLTVLENLRMGAYRIRKSRVFQSALAEVYARFPILGERRHQLAGTLSGGEQQQLAIARALMSQPRLILLDEPSLGLAPVIIDVVLDLIQDLRRDGWTLVLVEQNIHQALEIADRVYVLTTGKVRLEGEAARFRETGLDLERAYLGGSA